MINRLAKRIFDWFAPPYWAEGPIYREKAAWVDEFSSTDARHGRLALEQARINHAHVAESYERLDAKAAELLRTAGLIATILVAGVAHLGLGASLWVKLALCCLLGAMAVSAFSRRALLSPGGVPIRVLMQPLAECGETLHGEHDAIPNPEAWLAAAIEGATIAFRDLQEWKARCIHAATVLILAAMALLLPALFSI